MTSAVVDPTEYQDNLFAGLFGRFSHSVQAKQKEQTTTENTYQGKNEINLPQTEENKNLFKQPWNLGKTKAKTEEIQREFEAINN